MSVLVEDELTAIDDQPSEIGLEQIRRMFKKEGKEYLLSLNNISLISVKEVER